MDIWNERRDHFLFLILKITGSSVLLLQTVCACYLCAPFMDMLLPRNQSPAVAPAWVELEGLWLVMRMQGPGAGLLLQGWQSQPGPLPGEEWPGPASVLGRRKGLGDTVWGSLPRPSWTLSW